MYKDTLEIVNNLLTDIKEGVIVSSENETETCEQLFDIASIVIECLYQKGKVSSRVHHEIVARTAVIDD